MTKFKFFLYFFLFKRRIYNSLFNNVFVEINLKRDYQRNGEEKYTNLIGYRKQPTEINLLYLKALVELYVHIFNFNLGRFKR